MTAGRSAWKSAVVVRWVPAGVVVLAAVLTWLHWGTTAAELFRYALWLGVCVLLPGVVLSRIIRRGPRTGVEDLAIGFAFGSVLQVPVWWICLRLGLSYWWWPAVVAIAVLAVPAARARVLRPGLQAVSLQWSVAVACVCLITLGWLTGDFLRWTPAQPSTEHTYYGDLLFHLSVAAEAKRALPPTLPQVAGDPLYYHWFAHLDMAMASQGARLELSTVVFQLWVPTTVLAAIVIVAASVSHISGQPSAGPLAVVLIYAVGEVGLSSWNVSMFLPMTQFYAWASPSQSAATLFTLPAVAMAVDFYRAHEGCLRQLLLLGIPLFFGLALAKSSVLPVLIGAALVVVVVQHRRDHRASGRPVFVLGLLLVVFAISTVTIYGRQGGGLVLAPMETMLRYTRAYLGGALPPAAGATHVTTIFGVTVVVLVWAVTVLGRLGGLLLSVKTGRRGDIGLVFLIGGLVSGIGAYLVLAHPGGSQIYFLMSAFPLGAAASAWALAEHLPRSVPGCLILATATAVAAAAAWQWTPAIGLPRAGPGIVTQLAFVTRPTLIVVAVAGGLAIALVILHRLGRVADVSIVTVLAVVICAAGGATTLEYTFGSIPSTGVARARAQAPPSMATLAADDVRAARWLRDHTTADTVVATNRHCVEGQVFPGFGPKPTRCDVLSFWVSAWSERRVLVEGWAFGNRAVELEKQNGLTYKRQPFWDQELLRANDGFFRTPTAAKAAALCRYGATYAVLDRRYQPSLPSLADVAQQVYITSTVEIYRLPC